MAAAAGDAMRMRAGSDGTATNRWRGEGPRGCARADRGLPSTGGRRGQSACALGSAISTPYGGGGIPKGGAYHCGTRGAWSRRGRGLCRCHSSRRRRGQAGPCRRVPAQAPARPDASSSRSPGPSSGPPGTPGVPQPRGPLCWVPFQRLVPASVPGLVALSQAVARRPDPATSAAWRTSWATPAAWRACGPT